MKSTMFKEGDVVFYRPWSNPDVVKIGWFKRFDEEAEAVIYKKMELDGAHYQTDFARYISKDGKKWY